MGIVLMAGGGTVGHLAPGLAIRDALVAAGHRVLLVTPGEAREADWFPAGEPPRLHVKAPRLPRGLWSKVTFFPRMARSVLAARRMLKHERPDVVLALGGWPCATTAIAATLLKIPLALFAADAVPGIVVRKLEKRAARTYLVSEACLASLHCPEKALVVPAFIRRSVRDAVRDPARFELVEGKRTLLVVGGSLGSRGLNTGAFAGLEAAVAADPTLAERMQVIHSTGSEEGAVAASSTYRRIGVGAHVRPFISDIGEALQTADLVLCRGGASTLAEVAALRRPAVVVPYPHHADRQQWKNAEPLVARGAAVLVEEAALTPEVYRTQVLGRLFDPERLRSMAAAPRERGAGTESDVPIDGATTIALDLVRFFGTAG